MYDDVMTDQTIPLDRATLRIPHDYALLRRDAAVRTHHPRDAVAAASKMIDECVADQARRAGDGYAHHVVVRLSGRDRAICRPDVRDALLPACSRCVQTFCIRLS